MVMVYSYKVLLAKTEAKLYSLKSTFLLTQDTKIKNQLEMAEKEVQWIKQRIAEGKDPGCHIE